MNNPESQDMDADIQDNYQEDLENIEPNHLAGLRHLSCKIEELRQTIEANDDDPMDAINHLEQKLNQLAITLCPPTEPIGMFSTNAQTLYVMLKRKCLLKTHYYKIPPILNGNDSSQLEDWLTDIETTSELMGKNRTK